MLDVTRAIVSVASVGPALALILVAASQIDRPALETPCWILPNARILPVPGTQACPLTPHDLITAVLRDGRRFPFPGPGSLHQAAGSRDAIVDFEVMTPKGRAARPIRLRNVAAGEKAERTLVALLISAVTLAIPLAILWSSQAAAALPIALGYGLVAVVGIAAVAGRGSELLTSAAFLALSAAPSVMLHLALVFPRERTAVLAAPRLQWLPYLLLLVLVPAGMFALHAEPSLWPAFVSALLALAGAAWAGVVLACHFALRESESQLERARARTLAVGAVLLPLLPSLALAGENFRGPHFAAAYIASAAIALPIPIGLAITRYNLFDVGWDVRLWIGRAVYLLSAAALVAAAIRVGARGSLTGELSVSRVFLLAIAALALVDGLRDRMLAIFESMVLPSIRRLRRELEAFATRVATLRDEDEVGRLAGRAIEAALEPSGGCVFLNLDDVWRAICPFGPKPVHEVAIALDAVRFVADGLVAHLASEPLESRNDARELLSRGIEAVAPVHAGGPLLGLVVIRPRATTTPYSSFELDFVESVARYAAAALGNARMAADLMAAERHATTGRIALALAHDLGKELDWIARLAERLPDRFSEREKLRRDADQISDLADGALEALRDFVEESLHRQPDQLRLDEVAELAVRRTERLHGAGRIAVRIDPSLRTAPFHTSLVRAIASVLDNALRAGNAAAPVELFAVRASRTGRIVVRDRGCGMPAEMAARAFEAGFTSRSREGGLGIGLSTAAEIVRGLGGTIELESAPGEGTRVGIELPLREPCA